MANIRKRGTRWQVQIRRLGSPPNSKSFINKKDAQAWARQSEIQVDRNELPHDPRSLELYTLGELVGRYRDTVTPQKRSAKNEVIVLNAFLRHSICSKRLSDLTAKDFTCYRDERLQEVTAHSLKRILSPIQNLFEVVKEEWGIPIRDNPIRRLRIACLSNRRERRLRAAEFDKIIGAGIKTKNPLTLPIIHFALQTGLRRSEILAATWSDLDVANRVLCIPRAKNGHSRVIPLTLPALAVLQHLRDIGEQKGKVRIFPTTPNALRLSWERLIRRAGIEDLHFHDLRHKAISRLFELGLTTPEVALVSGHKDIRMLSRYAHGVIRTICFKLDRQELS